MLASRPLPPTGASPPHGAGRRPAPPSASWEMSMARLISRTARVPRSVPRSNFSPRTAIPPSIYTANIRWCRAKTSSTYGRSGPVTEERAMKQAFRADHAVPISKAVRAGDFVFTSAYGPWLFDPRDLTFDADGNMLDDGTGKKDIP